MNYQFVAVIKCAIEGCLQDQDPSYLFIRSNNPGYFFLRRGDAFTVVHPGEDVHMTEIGDDGEHVEKNNKPDRNREVNIVETMINKITQKQDPDDTQHAGYNKAATERFYPGLCFFGLK